MTNEAVTIKLNFLAPLLVLLGCAVPLFAEYPPELYDFLVYVNTQPSITDIETKIIEYEEKYAGRLYEYTEVLLHKLRILRESIGSRERLDTLNMLDERWAALAAQRDLTSDEYRVWADVLNMRIPLVPMKKLIQDSRSAYEYFNTAIRLDKRNAAAHRNLGTWSLFAPRIAGGGLNKALKSLKRAVALSDNDLDRYFALIWLSQVHMKKGDEKNHAQALDEAGEIFGETVFLGYVRDQNKNGKMIGE